MSDEIVIKETQPKYILRIEKLKPSNFGSYTCRASSELGTDEASIDVTGNIEHMCQLKLMSIEIFDKF